MNKVMLIGNVGKDPDVHYYDADQAVAQVSLATTERGYTLENGMQVPDHTDWHNLVFFRALAKYVEKYVRKGDKLSSKDSSPESRLQTLRFATIPNVLQDKLLLRLLMP
jgi:single stranded DNA-binding protein